jgi:hypothetical protein
MALFWCQTFGLLGIHEKNHSPNEVPNLFGLIQEHLYIYIYIIYSLSSLDGNDIFSKLCNEEEEDKTQQQEGVSFIFQPET